MGIRKVKNESILRRMVLPTKNSLLGIAVKFLSGEIIIVKCQDGKERLCRILGKLKRRVSTSEHNTVWFLLGVSSPIFEATYSEATERNSRTGLETSLPENVRVKR